MKLRNILMVVAAMGIMFASMDRTAVVGYTEGDYTDMHTFAHKVAGQNVAYTMGDDFTAVWSDGGTTWGFSSGYWVLLAACVRRHWKASWRFVCFTVEIICAKMAHSEFRYYQAVLCIIFGFLTVVIFV